MITIINLFGGPGTSKSTTSAELFSILKKENFNTELIREFAKDIVYEENYNQLTNQFYISAMQQKRFVDVIKYFEDRNEDAVIVTDSPILMGVFFNTNDMNPYLNDCIIQEFSYPNGYEVCNINIFLKRVKKYNQHGRVQTEEEAKEIDKKMLRKLKYLNIDFVKVTASKTAAKDIYNLLESRLKGVV